MEAVRSDEVFYESECATIDPLQNELELKRLKDISSVSWFNSLTKILQN